MYPALQAHCGPEGALLAEHAAREHRELSREVGSSRKQCLAAAAAGVQPAGAAAACCSRADAKQHALTPAWQLRPFLQVDSVLGILLEDHDRLLAGQVGASGRVRAAVAQRGCKAGAARCRVAPD